MILSSIVGAAGMDASSGTFCGNDSMIMMMMMVIVIMEKNQPKKMNNFWLCNMHFNFILIGN